MLSNDCAKVETIGDAYMVVSGLPQRNGNRHVVEVANTALELLQHIKKFKVPHMPSLQLKLRIGLHTGPCAAGNLVLRLSLTDLCLNI